MTRDYAAPDWRGLCEELVDEVTARPLILDRALIDRARAALAQPEPEGVGPTDEEIADAFAEGCRDGSKAGEPPFLGGARAVLARWGRPAPAPAEGEVGELVTRLRRASDGASAMGWEQDSWVIARAADLLERQVAPVPVAVSERFPEAGDCLGRPTEDSDAGWCWTYCGALEVWRFQPVVFPRSYPEPPLVILSPSVTHWLPHHALPLPSGEAIAAELEGAG